MIWTKEKVAELLALDAQGKTSTEIIKIMGEGLNRNMVLGKLHRTKEKRKVTPAKPRPKPPRTKPVQGLAEIEAWQCRWPLDCGFCGAVRVRGADWPYCEEHQIKSRRKIQ